MTYIPTYVMRVYARDKVSCATYIAWNSTTVLFGFEPIGTPFRPQIAWRRCPHTQRRVAFFQYRSY